MDTYEDILKLFNIKEPVGYSVEENECEFKRMKMLLSGIGEPI